MIRRWAWLLAISVLAAGCHATSVSVTFAHPRKLAAGWVRSDLKPVTQPELAAGLLVLYVAAGENLQVDALDPKTGRTVWHDSASPGGITPGVSPILGVAGSTVVFLNPVGSKTNSAQVVGVDAATGRVLWRTPAGVFTDWPGPCPDDSPDICTTGFTPDGQQTVALRFRASDGEPAGNTLISQSQTGIGRSLGPDLFDPGGRNPEMLLAVSGASVAWTRTLASVFPVPGLSTDNGWDFALVPAAGLYVGSVAGPPVSSTGSSAVIDLSRNMTAGFRISDGTAVWRDPGTTFACGQPLPCPGAASPAEEDQGAAPAPTEGLRLRATGTVSVSQSSPVPRPSPGTDVAVEGFALATGKTLWSYNAGSDVSLFSQTPPLLAANVVVLPAPGGGMVALNLATGARHPAPAAAVAWCQSPVYYRTQVAYQAGNGRTGNERAGQEEINPCRASGASVAAPRTVPGSVGTVVDGLTVWSESSEVAAAPTSS